MKVKKESLNSKKEKQSGITLIALVVTIVILIILATISINAVIGENGLIAKAEQAKQLQENKIIEEEEKLGMLENKIAEHLPTDEQPIPDNEKLLPTTGAGSKVTKPTTWTDSTGKINDKVIALNNGNNVAIPLPSDFYYVGGDIDSGIVISDSKADANKGTSYDVASTLIGNQFVWIPATESTFVRTDFDKTTGATKTLSSANTEPLNYTGYETEESEYNTMCAQVIKYGGFYIARYEAGDLDSKDANGNPTLRTGATIAHKVISKKGVAPYNWVPWGKDMNDASEVEGKSGAVYLSKNMYSTSDSVTSTLCYGVQWDAMCRYIEDNYRTTPAKSVPELTGSVSTDVSKNIYDLAGNCSEWTMEARNDSIRNSRGGHYSNASPVSVRLNFSPANTGANRAFRPALYIK